MPDALIVEAHRAARRGADLSGLVSDCCAGYALFCDCVLRAVEEDGAQVGSRLRDLLQVVATLFERVLVAMTAEHARERRRWPRASADRQLGCVKALLSGDPSGPLELAYEIRGWHVGTVARGPEPAANLRELARRSDSRLLLVRPDAETAWAWLGGRRKADVGALAAIASSVVGADELLAFGEPAQELAGWRLTHQQAKAALRAAPVGKGGIVRYADVGLLSAIAQDEVLVRSLHQMYLRPLAEARHGGVTLRETLRAYFAANRNVSSAASALGVSRQTVSSRLRATEELVGRPLETCVPQLEAALTLERLGSDPDTFPPRPLFGT